MSTWSILHCFALVACSCTGASTGGEAACDASVDGQCSADSTLEPASPSLRTCEPEDPCIVCNAYSEDCKLPSEAAINANPGADEVMGQAIGQKIQHQVRQRIDQRVAAGDKLQILFIGPNKFDTESQAFKFLFGDQMRQADIVFVDPIKDALETAKKYADGVGFNSVQALHAGAGDVDGSLPFWWYEPQCARKVFTSIVGAFEMDKQYIDPLVDYLSYWTSTQKEGAMFSLSVHWVVSMMQEQKNYSPEVWEGGVLQLNEECLQAFDVPVLSPQALMEASGFSLEKLDVLFVDAEGMDTTIMKAFLAQPDFDPAWIQFEWWFPNMKAEGRVDLARVLGDLSARGFDVHMVQHDLQVLRPLKG